DWDIRPTRALLFLSGEQLFSVRASNLQPRCSSSDVFRLPVENEGTQGSGERPAGCSSRCPAGLLEQERSPSHEFGKRATSKSAFPWFDVFSQSAGQRWRRGTVGVRCWRWIGGPLRDVLAGPDQMAVECCWRRTIIPGPEWALSSLLGTGEV